MDHGEARSALRRGRSVESFLGLFDHAEGPAVRYVVIDERAGSVEIRVYESLESNCVDFYGFPEADSALGQGDAAKELQFDTFTDAVSWLSMEYPGAGDRLVNQGVCEAVYWDLKVD